MGCLTIFPIATAMAVLALNLGSFLGFFLTSFTAVITSLGGLLGLLLLL